MATFYIGEHPTLRGRSEKEFSFAAQATRLSGKPHTAVGVYSFYQLFAPGLLTGFPDNNHVIGTGYKPHDLFMSRRFLGLDTKNPMDKAGSGVRLVGFRYRPWEYKGLLSSAALNDKTLGHLPKRGIYYQEYDNYTFDGVPSTDVFLRTGHPRRKIGSPGTAFSFGAFDPWVNKGVGMHLPLDGASEIYPTGTDFNHLYGKNRVLEWRGAPSALALGKQTTKTL